MINLPIVSTGPLSLAIVSEGSSVKLKAVVVASVNENVGGGSAAGVVQASASISATAEASLSAQQAVDLGFLAIEAALPALKPILEGIRAAADAEIAKLLA